MPVTNKKLVLDSEAGAKVIQALTEMADDVTYNTGDSYSANGEKYPDNKISFVDKHINYLLSHSSVNPDHYLANLRLMTRKT